MKTICLDPAAHWPDNFGLNGYSERNGAWDIARACRHVLHKCYSTKCRIVLTRENKGDLQLKYPKYLQEEVRRINASGADFALSIHTDANKSAAPRGVTCFKGGVLSEKFGCALLDAIEGQFERATLPLFKPYPIDHYKGRNYLAVIRETKMPTCLIECGFHTNADDIQLLGTLDGRKSIGYALADGIADFFEWEAGVENENPTEANSDVDDWFKPWVERAIGEGILTGYPDGSFRGQQPVTRQELAVAMVRLKDRLALDLQLNR